MRKNLLTILLAVATLICLVILCLNVDDKPTIEITETETTTETTTEIAKETTTESTTKETTTSTNTTTTIPTTTPATTVTTTKAKKLIDSAYKYRSNLTPLQNEIYGYVLAVCKKYPDVPPSMVMAIIEHESNFDRYAVNYNGTCFGLMQIYKNYNLDRMARLGVVDLFDAYGNILVGVDLLSELYHYYGNREGAFRQYSGGVSSFYPWVINRMTYYE